MVKARCGAISVVEEARAIILILLAFLLDSLQGVNELLLLKEGRGVIAPAAPVSFIGDLAKLVLLA
jgi:hypothetical protein